MSNKESALSLQELEAKEHIMSEMIGNIEEFGINMQYEIQADLEHATKRLNSAIKNNYSTVEDWSREVKFFKDWKEEYLTTQKPFWDEIKISVDNQRFNVIFNNINNITGAICIIDTKFGAVAYLNDPTALYGTNMHRFKRIDLNAWTPAADNYIYQRREAEA